jgi:hypothetical protein
MVLSSTLMWPIIQEDFTAIVQHDSNLMYVLSQLTPVIMHDRVVNTACSSLCRKQSHKITFIYTGDEFNLLCEI